MRQLGFLALSVPAICMAQAQNQPRLVLEEPHFDFGAIPSTPPVTHRFKVLNAGQAPLTISQLKPSCGCTSTIIGKQVVGPGERTELEITFNPAGYQGPVQKSLEVVSDDPNAPSQILTFEATVQFPVTVSPDQILFQDLRPTDHRKISIKVESQTESTIGLVTLEMSKAPWLGVATHEAEKTLWVDLDLLASRLPPGQLSGIDTITLRVVNPSPVTVPLVIHWDQHPPVEVVPPRVAWSEAAGQERRASLTLTHPGHTPFRILAARTSDPRFTVLSLPDRAARQQKLDVVLSAAAPAGHYEAFAFFTLDTPGHPELMVRLSAVLH